MNIFTEINPLFIIIPVISGLVGWGTNYLAVRMIFRPYKPINILGFKIQGLIPKRRDDLALSISETVSEHLISHEDFTKQLKSVNINSAFRELINDKLEHFIQVKLFSFSPMIAGFLNDTVKEKIKDLLMEEIIDLLPELAEKMATHVEKSFDTKKLIYEKVSSFEIEKLESIILNIATKELKAIEILGGILGIIIGFIQVFIIQFFNI